MEKITKETRSNVMRAIKSKSKLEDSVSKELWKKGIRFRKNTKSLFGKPDISIIKYKVVIFIDSCFWHFCPIHGHMPLSNLDYWEKKLQRNMNRDKTVNRFYQDKGWNILRIWEHQIRNDFDSTVEEIVHYIDSCKQQNNKTKKLLNPNRD